MKFTIELLDQMEGHEFEHAVADILFHNGFRDVKVTQASGDYGVDVLARKREYTYAIQCKRYESTVGVKAVQEAASGAEFNHCSSAVVVTNNYFTRQAITLANTTGVRLWGREELIKLLEEYDEEYDELDPVNAKIFDEYQYKSVNISDDNLDNTDNIVDCNEYNKTKHNQQIYQNGQIYKIEKMALYFSQEGRLQRVNKKKEQEGMYISNGTKMIGMGIRLENNEVFTGKSPYSAMTRKGAIHFSHFLAVSGVIIMIISVLPIIVLPPLGIAFFLFGLIYFCYSRKFKHALKIQFETVIKKNNNNKGV